MCGRFVVTTKAEVLWERFRATSGVRELKPRYNLAPSQEAPVIVASPEGRELALMRWGLVPSWAESEKIGYKLINARAETVAEKPSFRKAFRQTRCLVPSDGFFEWLREGTKKTPYFFHRRDGLPFAYAGLWEHWLSSEGKELRSFSILTTDANACVEPVHKRMPLILDPHNEQSWLNPLITDPASIQALIQPYPADLMERYEVSSIVNKAENDDAACIKAV